jgi:hypothetical protein
MLSVILFIAFLPGCERDGDLDEQRLHQHYQLRRLDLRQHDARFVQIEQSLLRFEIRGFAFHARPSPSSTRTGERLGVHRPRRASIAGLQTESTARSTA